MKTNPYICENKQYEKIVKQYHKYGSIVVGVDFDFTLRDLTKGFVYSDILDLLKRGNRKEIIYCIWTANNDSLLVSDTWKENGITYDYYNQSPINPGCIKPHFNILLDDTAGLGESSRVFERFLDYLEKLS